MSPPQHPCKYIYESYRAADCFNQIINMSVLFSAHILIFSPHPDKIWDLYNLFSWKVSSDFVDTGPV